MFCSQEWLKSDDQKCASYGTMCNVTQWTICQFWLDMHYGISLICTMAMSITIERPYSAHSAKYGLYIWLSMHYDHYRETIVHIMPYLVHSRLCHLWLGHRLGSRHWRLVEDRAWCVSVVCNPGFYSRRVSFLVAATLWSAIKQVRMSAAETGVSFKDYGEFDVTTTLICVI